MENKKSMKIRSIISCVVLAMFFMVYNISFFLFFGYTIYLTKIGEIFPLNYGVSYWSSYAFVILAFVVVGVTLLVTLLMKSELKDAFLRLPIFIHSIAFFIFELIVSSVFMALNLLWFDLWFISITVQLVLLAIHIAVIISSFFVKSHIKKVDDKVKDKTNFIRLLKVDVDLIAEMATDNEVREAYIGLSDQVRYSDPMSHESLFELEKQILECLSLAKRCVEQGKSDAALKNCEIASRLLFERNEKTKVLK